ncbi:MAG: hypothetical protein ACRETC_02305 [Gammaproteobacteria bacterium]
MNRYLLMKKKFEAIAVVGFAALLAGCGGATHSSLGGGGSGGGGGGGGGTSTTVELGSGSGSSFQQGVLAVAVANLSAGGSTTVSASLQNSDGTPYTQSATITFTSVCYQNGLATFTENGTATNTVTTTTGQANITYTASGCSGSDTITATTSAGGATLTAVGTVMVASASVGAIQFVSATPPTISLQGSGGPSTSTIIFQVTDSSGGPVPKAKVSFSLNTTVGGITLSPASATSGNNGQVQTVVQAGTQHTTVRVTASVKTASGQTISTQSPGIVISTGTPTEHNFSLSLATHNLEAFNIDNVTDTVTVRMSDRFFNPVPDGTAVSFTTNGGQIQPSCTTVGGSCSVTWTSANPRPPGGPLSVIGHAEILAYATGEESFTDVNGNGVFDGPDQFSVYSGGAGDNFFGPPGQDDIGEVYLDQNESGYYVSGDYFFDFNKDGIRNPPDGKYHGSGCQGTATVSCGTPTLGIGLQDCIVMSTSGVTITGPSSISIPGTATYLVSDENGNVPPSGMTFSIVASGPSVSILQGAVPDIGCALSPPGPGTGYPITVTVPSSSQNGTFVIEAKSPSNLVSYSQPIHVGS